MESTPVVSPHIHNHKIKCRVFDGMSKARSHLNPRASEFVGSGFWQLTCQLRKWFIKLSARLVTVLLNKCHEIWQNQVNSSMIIAYNTVYCACDKEFDSYCCRFATMSRVKQHGGCRIASPAWASGALLRLDSGAPRAGEGSRGTSARLVAAGK